MEVTHPSREEARRYRREIQDAVQAVRSGETPEKTALAWPAGLDRRLLLGLPIERRIRNCLLRARVAGGDSPLTVDELLRIPLLTEPLLPDLLFAIDRFLDDYTETFEEIPRAADVAAMRLIQRAQTVTPTETTVVEERVLARPPSRSGQSRRCGLRTRGRNHARGGFDLTVSRRACVRVRR